MALFGVAAQWRHSGSRGAHHQAAANALASSLTALYASALTCRRACLCAPAALRLRAQQRYAHYRATAWRIINARILALMAAARIAAPCRAKLACRATAAPHAARTAAAKACLRSAIAQRHLTRLRHQA